MLTGVKDIFEPSLQGELGSDAVFLHGYGRVGHGRWPPSEAFLRGCLQRAQHASLLRLRSVYCPETIKCF